MQITRQDYPNIFKAFDDITHDNCVSRLYTENTFYTESGVDLATVEKFIGKLPNEAREIMTMGDQDEAEEKFGKDPIYQDANKLLNEFFDSL